MTRRFLDAIVRAKRREIEALRAGRRSLAAALGGPGLALIAEIKRASPSRGPLRAELDPAALAARYERAGAAAVSVLTDAASFGARHGDLPAARAATTLPVLRKDFVLDPIQLDETVALGADAVLLIVRLLDDVRLRDLLRGAADRGLEALVEAHDAGEIDRALAAGARIVGVNSRDLDTFEVDLDRTLALRARIPADVSAVAESGIADADDLGRVRDAGFDGALCGEALMRADDPGDAVRALLRGADA